MDSAIYRGYQLNFGAQPLLGGAEWRPLLRVDHVETRSAVSSYMPLTQAKVFLSPEEALVYARDYGMSWVDEQLAKAA
jgi:hypothetical protein